MFQLGIDVSKENAGFVPAARRRKGSVKTRKLQNDINAVQRGNSGSVSNIVNLKMSISSWKHWCLS